MSRPILFDATFLAAHLQADAPTGIERVDAVFARHFLSRQTGKIPSAVHYGLFRPHVLAEASAQQLLAEADRAWRAEKPESEDAVFAGLADWLRAPANAQGPRFSASALPSTWSAAVRRTSTRTRWRLRSDGSTVPHGAVVVNVAQYAFEHPRFFRWLDTRPDVTPVMFIHDLLPLDCPEFFRPRAKAVFERRFTTMLRARALLASNAEVAAHITEALARSGRPGLPVFCDMLPPPAPSLEGARPVLLDGAAPYFVIVGTIEPRKNHLLLLHIWRELAQGLSPPPRLVLVGGRGWENEQTIDLIERSADLKPHVAEARGLSIGGLRHLIAGARALLMPSFAEGYGLPIAEGLAQGVPVVASDIPVFRTVSQDKALLIDPLDGPSWRRAILDLAMPASPLRDDLVRRAQAYRSTAWVDYFAALDGFLAGL